MSEMQWLKDTAKGKPAVKTPLARKIEDLERRRNIRFDHFVHRFDLIHLGRIADWCSRTPGTLTRDERLREQCWENLAQSIIDGEFGPHNKPYVLYLPKEPKAEMGKLILRVTSTHLLEARVKGQNLIPDLWVSRDHCIKWFATYSITSPPFLKTEKAQNSVGEQARIAISTLQRPLCTNPTTKGRPTDDQIREIIRKLYPDTMPGIPVAESRILEEIKRSGFKPAGGDERIRKILGEPEFKSKRAPPGRPIKNK